MALFYLFIQGDQTASNICGGTYKGFMNKIIK